MTKLIESLRVIQLVEEYQALKAIEEDLQDGGEDLSYAGFVITKETPEYVEIMTLGRKIFDRRHGEVVAELATLGVTPDEIEALEAEDELPVLAEAAE